MFTTSHYLCCFTLLKLHRYFKSCSCPEHQWVNQTLMFFFCNDLILLTRIRTCTVCFSIAFFFIRPECIFHDFITATNLQCWRDLLAYLKTQLPVEKPTQPPRQGHQHNKALIIANINTPDCFMCLFQNDIAIPWIVNTRPGLCCKVNWISWLQKEK